MSASQDNSAFSALKLIGSGQAFRSELCAMLETTQMFRDFEWHDIEVLSGYMQAYEADKGVTLFREGENGTYLCLIIKGKVDIIKGDQHDKEKVFTSIGPGKTLGEMAIIDGEPRSATAIVAEPTTLAILTKANFHRIINEKPGLATNILLKVARLLSQRLRHTSGQLVDYLES